VLIAFVAVLVGGMTTLPKESWWRDATFAPPLETAVIAAKPRLPAEVAKRIRYR
jgi:membrane protein required for colicin V production